MKDERFNNSRIFDCFRRFVCIFTCFILCICLLPPSLSFADTEPYTDTITYVQNGGNYLPRAEAESGKYPLVVNNNNNSTNQYITYWKQTSNVPDIDIYAFLVNSVPYVVVPYYDISLGGYVYASLQARDVYINKITFDPNNQAITYDEDRQLLYSSFSPRTSNTNTLPSFNSVEDGLNAISGGGSLPNDGFEGTLIVPAGNVAYVQINGGDMELTAVMNSKSGLIMGGNAWGNNARISYGVSSYPSSGTTFPLSGSDLIPWMKQAEGQDLLGRTRYAGYPRSGLTTSDNFIVIYNPASASLASQGFDNGEDELNPSITASFSKLVTYRIYPLTQSYNVQTNELTSESISDYDDYFNGTPDENGQFTETPSSPGMPSQAQPGGTGGLSDSSQSIGDYIRNITNILSNFVNNVIALIQVPISHIGQLIDSGSGFMSALRGLYAWLPVDIQGLVISALTVVIGIGVFKVFL